MSVGAIQDDRGDERSLVNVKLHVKLSRAPNRGFSLFNVDVVNFVSDRPLLPQ